MPPRHENGITCGAGTLYIEGEKFGEVKDAELESLEIHSAEGDMFEYIGNLCGGEFTARFELARKTWERFARVITGVEQTMYDICPNRRVVHLAKHAKKFRVRKKNYSRMIRICERYGV